jgi:hypothetical protein
MRHSIIFIILLMALCIGQEKVPEEQVQEELLPEETPSIPDDLIKNMILSYFEALNQRNLNTLKSLTHPYYAADVQPFLEYVSENSMTFGVVTVSFLMDEDEFREMTKNLSDAEFSEQIGKRGLSYEVEMSVTTHDATYEEFFLFVYVGETDSGWKVIDPYLLQLLIESELEVLQLEEEED